MVAIALAGGHAVAGERVLHDDQDAGGRAALALVTGAAGRPAAALDAVAVSDLLAGGPLFGGRTEACAGPVRGPREVELGLAEAEGAINYLEIDKANIALNVVDSLLPCLGEPAPPALLLRAALLRGYAASLGGAPPAAIAAFARAHAAQPDLGWDELRNARHGRDAFERAAADVRSAPAAIVIVPEAPGAAPLFVDGRAIGAGVHRLPPGRHLLQSGAAPARGWWAWLDEGQRHLAVPGGIDGARVLAWVADPAARPDLDLLLAAGAAPSPATWIVEDHRLWSRAGDATDWSEIETTRWRHRHTTARVAAWTGGALAVLSAGAVTAAWLAGRDAADACAEARLKGDAEVCVAREGGWEAAGTVWVVGLGAGGLGVASLGAGLLIERAAAGTSMQPVATAAVQARWAW